jgi:NAD(P)-dependent dehydrogenase (short-subunit alcohol dehydrogenase family)
MGRLAGKVALITGAGNGQGSVEAYLFAREGAKVIATDIAYENVKKVVNKINREFGEVAIALMHDVSSEKDWKRVVEEGVNRFGPITVLVNNAGVLSMDTYEEVSHENWSRVMDINAWGQFVGMRTVVPYMKEAGIGSIVNISSLASLVSVRQFNAYTASKGAIESLTKTAATELGGYNIRVNSVHPGSVKTNMFTAVYADEAAMEKRKNNYPLKRIGTPEDIAYGVLYLASDESSYVTGIAHVIDGGIMAQ